MTSSNGLYLRFSDIVSQGKDAALLAVRLTLAYGFYGPAMAKWNGIDSVAGWFATLGIPLPQLSAYLAASTELLGVIFLSTGLLTRLISVPLIVVMVVAILTVHLGNGFSCGDNGFEIPFYYILFLFVLLTAGPGRWSLDRFFCEKRE